MRLLADEGVDRQIVDRLRHDGHDVIHVAEVSPALTDEAVLSLAHAEGRILVTADKDFGDMMRRQRWSGSVVLLRLAGLRPDRKASIVSEALRAHGPAIEAGAIAVITPGLARLRRGGP